MESCKDYWLLPSSWLYFLEQSSGLLIVLWPKSDNIYYSSTHNDVSQRQRRCKQLRRTWKDVAFTCLSEKKVENARKRIGFFRLRPSIGQKSVIKRHHFSECWWQIYCMKQFPLNKEVCIFCILYKCSPFSISLSRSSVLFQWSLHL